jgi:uncharacterized protein YjbJ (UPF0337 family)
MNWDIIEGKWDQVKGSLKSAFGKLTDDDLKNLAGKRDRVLGKVQERYGIQKDEAERRLDTWINEMGPTDSPQSRH